MIGQLIAAFLGTVAFGFLFGIPRRYYAYSGLCGSVAWGVYVLPVWGSDVIASFAATMVATFLSRFFAVKKTVSGDGVSHRRPDSPGTGNRTVLDFLLSGDQSAGADVIHRAGGGEVGLRHCAGNRICI